MTIYSFETKQKTVISKGMKTGTEDKYYILTKQER